jgi:cytochrome b6-f complex iron-sulfur subunit
MLLRAGAGGALALLVAQWFGVFMAFFWPKNVGAFGSKMTVGKADDFAIGSVTRVREGRFFLVRLPEGFVALYWKCPHLGCTVPWEPSENRFHCPCHGSIYEASGERVSGPAPRPLDMMAVSITGGKVVVDTSAIIQRERWEPSQAVKA